ncbi:hypothetical protein Q0812_01960 [Brevundimonas sp. 2R-24]|uniref:Uncharacterized protein n=1 Tax=Peiella sedimenti TaxID=3061083 RepID=A0ABT8SI04_9CAUL|nr:hypothetical protein [Caulobacteraceae bacterium XZ-24]
MRTPMAVIGAAALLGACATGPDPQSLPQVQAWLAANGPTPPPIAQCPHVAGIDLAAIAEEQSAPPTEQQLRSRAFISGMFDEMRLPEGAWRSPPAEPVVMIRSIHPPAGMHPNTMWAWVWKEADGTWWMWRQNRTNTPPPPPPPPPPGATEGTPAWEAYVESVRNWRVPDEERWPPEHGRLNAEMAATLDRVLANPCRAWEPDIWPWDPPLRPRRRQPAPPHPHDWTPVYVELTEPGRAPRRLAAPGNNRESLNGAIVGVAAYPRPSTGG